MIQRNTSKCPPCPIVELLILALAVMIALFTFGCVPSLRRPASPVAMSVSIPVQKSLRIYWVLEYGQQASIYYSRNLTDWYPVLFNGAEVTTNTEYFAPETNDCQFFKIVITRYK